MNFRSIYLLAAGVASLVLFTWSGCSQAKLVRKPATDVSAMSEGMNMSELPMATEQDCLNNPAGPPTTQVSAAQQAVINQTVTNRGHRLQHALWHAMRSGLSSQQDHQVDAAYGLVWSQVHNYCPPPTADFNQSGYNPVGEDFLFMHHEMVASIRGALIHAKLQCIASWPSIPDPKVFSVPDADPNSNGPKSDATYALLKVWNSSLQENSWLASHSLSQLGMAVELSVHNNLHMRYATNNPPAGFSGVAQTGGAPIPYDGNFSANWPYDSPNYNWLADPYGAALNPYFWMIHGYVDHLIDLWLNAHPPYKSVSINCAAGDSTCYSWQGRWTGALPQSFGPTVASRRKNSRHPAAESNNSNPTTSFNQNRMVKQWLGVVGGPPSLTGHPKNPGDTAVAPPSSGPFQYAVDQACSATD